MKKIILYSLTILLISSCFREDITTIRAGDSNDTLSKTACLNDSINIPIMRVISDYMDSYTPIISPCAHKTVYTISFSKSINSEVFFELYSSNRIALIIDEKDENYDLVGMLKYKSHLIAIYDYPNDSLNQILYSAYIFDKDSFENFIEEDRKKFSYGKDTMPIWSYAATYQDSIFTIKKVSTSAP